jgi:hypothetical protein
VISVGVAILSTREKYLLTCSSSRFTRRVATTEKRFLA